MMTAWLYDFLLARGGAETVTLAVAEAAQIDRTIVAAVERESFPMQPAIHAIQRRRPATNAFARALSALWTFRRSGGLLGDCRTVVYSGHYSLAAPAPARARRIYYAHSLPLGMAFRGTGSPAKAVLGALHDRWLFRQLRSMDRVFANSHHCALAYRRAGIAAEIMRPPMDLGRFSWQPSEGYYLSVARHEPNKRVIQIVRAFLDLPDKQLVVAGAGSCTDELRSLAGGAPNIRFVGECKGVALAELISRAIATIHVPRAEALGLVVLESLAAGKPVIANAGGAHDELLSHSVNGLLLGPDPNPAEIADAVEQMDDPIATGMRQACEQSAWAPGTEEFLVAILGPPS